MMIEKYGKCHYVCVLLLFLTFLIGCTKSDDPRQFQITGMVTLNGEPIESGKIMFSPKGKGPAGIASIINGKYRTKGVGGKGVVGGPHRVEIECFIQAPGDAEETIEGAPVDPKYVNPLPNGHSEEWDIPTDQTNIKKDFEITS